MAQNGEFFGLHLSTDVHVGVLLQLFHGGNTGSNPVGDAKDFNGLGDAAET
jgi:hypothetical protein